MANYCEICGKGTMSGMNGSDLKTAKEQIDNGKKNVVAIEFTDEGPP